MSAKNIAKNTLLVVLVLLLAVLAAANWLIGLNFRQLPADNALRSLYDKLQGGAAGYELRSSGIAAAEPSQLALRVNGGLYGVQYSTAGTDTGLKAMRGIWAKALSGGKLEEASETELSSAIVDGGCAVLRYHGYAPLSVIAGWLGGEWDEGLEVGTLVYSNKRGKVFMRAKDGSLYASDAKVGKAILNEAAEAFRGQPCRFALMDYGVYPETLLFENESLTLPVLSTSPPVFFDPQSGADLEALIGAFGFAPYARSYSEQGGQARVFVNGRSTLRVTAAGLVQYSSSGGGNVKAYDEGEADNAEALAAQLDCARLALESALTAGGTGTRFSLYGAEQEGRRTTLVFLQTYGGTPVIGNEDFATFEFSGGSLVSAEVRLQRFKAENFQHTVMPSEQAAAAAAGEGVKAKELIVAYREREGRYIPERYYIVA